MVSVVAVLVWQLVVLVLVGLCVVSVSVGTLVVLVSVGTFVVFDDCEGSEKYKSSNKNTWAMICNL
jgi:hypothetical protein